MQELLNTYSDGIVSSLIAWVISLVFTAFVTFLVSRVIFERRFTNMLNKSLDSLNQAIEHSAPKLDIYAVGDAEKIVELFDIHTSNYHSISKIVKNDQIEEIRTLLKQTQQNQKLIRSKLIKLKGTWVSTVLAMKNSKKIFEKELGIKG